MIRTIYAVHSFGDSPVQVDIYRVITISLCIPYEPRHPRGDNYFDLEIAIPADGSKEVYIRRADADSDVPFTQHIDTGVIDVMIKSVKRPTEEWPAMKVGQFLSSYLKADDLKSPVDITISDAKVQKVGDDGEKVVMFSDDLESSVVLNKTNLAAVIELMGSDDTDDWIGQKITIFRDPNVKYMGKKTGGIAFKECKAGEKK